MCDRDNNDCRTNAYDKHKVDSFGHKKLTILCFRFKQDNIPILKNEIFFVKVIDIIEVTKLSYKLY